MNFSCHMLRLLNLPKCTLTGNIISIENYKAKKITSNLKVLALEDLPSLCFFLCLIYRTFGEPVLPILILFIVVKLLLCVYSQARLCFGQFWSDPVLRELIGQTGQMESDRSLIIKLKVNVLFSVLQHVSDSWCSGDKRVPNCGSLGTGFRERPGNNYEVGLIRRC